MVFVVGVTQLFNCWRHNKFRRATILVVVLSGSAVVVLVIITFGLLGERRNKRQRVEVVVVRV